LLFQRNSSLGGRLPLVSAGGFQSLTMVSFPTRRNHFPCPMESSTLPDRIIFMPDESNFMLHEIIFMPDEIIFMLHEIIFMPDEITLPARQNYFLCHKCRSPCLLNRDHRLDTV
jgi:hypothetical protein